MFVASSVSWQTISAHLDEALNLTREARTAYLRKVREQNANLASLLEGLLREYDLGAKECLLEVPPAVLPIRETPLSGAAIGAYVLQAPIGQGGMGIVWLAERSDGLFQRQVAIKFLKASVSGPGAEQRFKREGNILGRFTHPNIAQLLDAGLWREGQPYLILEYVEGQHIDRYCDDRRLDTESRLRLFLDLLSAVEYAHANLIVHRDIKPSNVLVTEDGKVKLLDFGIAKLVERPENDATATLDAGAALTPEYAAPEQLTAGPVTTATDIYTLGVLLYILIAGQHPAGRGPHSSADLMKAIVESEPPRLSDVAKTNRAVRGDLDTIGLKMLKKDPRERYLSVAALADDLRRYLAHEPIGAQPDSLVYRAGKFVRRNRTAATLAVLAFAASVAGLVGTVTQAVSARAQRDFALRQLSRAEAINDLNSFVLSDAAPSGKPFTVNELLGRAEHLVQRRSPGKDVSQVELLLTIGLQYSSQDEDDSARRVLEKAYQLSRGLADRSTRARASCALASALSRGLEKAGRAEGLIHEGLSELTGEPQFVLDRVFCLQRGSDVAQEQGSPREAVELARQARDLTGQSPLRTELLDFRALTELAEAYRYAGQYRAASDAFERASSILSSLGREDTQTAGTLLNNWGLAEWAMGHPLKADRMFRRAIAISSSGGNQESVSPMLLTNEARVLRALARYREAADYSERAYAIATKAGDEVVVTQSLVMLASAHNSLGNGARAAELLSQVETRLRRKLPSEHPAFANLAVERSFTAELGGDLTSALGLTNDAFGIVEASVTAGRGGEEFRPFLFFRRSTVELKMRRPIEAAEDARRALALAQKSAEPGAFSSALGRSHLALGRALLTLGERDEGLSALRTASAHLINAMGPDHPDSRLALTLIKETDSVTRASR